MIKMQKKDFEAVFNISGKITVTMTDVGDTQPLNKVFDELERILEDYIDLEDIEIDLISAKTIKSLTKE